MYMVNKTRFLHFVYVHFYELYLPDDEDGASAGRVAQGNKFKLFHERKRLEIKLNGKNGETEANFFAWMLELKRKSCLKIEAKN